MAKKILEKHKMLFKDISENIGNKRINKTKALIDAGYSESYAKSGQIHKTKSWNALTERYLSDEKLAKVHDKLLSAKYIKQLNFNYKIKDKEIQDIIEKEGYTFIGTKRFMTTATVFFSVPDGLVVKSALDLAYKLKNKYGDIVVRHKFGELSDAELEEQLAEEMAKLAIDGSK